METKNTLLVLVMVLALAGGSRAADPDPRGQALLTAVARGDVAGTKELLKAGVPVTVRNSEGWSPLIIAAERGDLPMTRLLVDAGASVNDRSLSDIGSPVLNFATADTKLALMEFLIDHGADVNRRGRSGITPLYSAAFHDHTQAVALLIRRGANVNAFANRSGSGYLTSPLVAAASRGNLRMIDLLLVHKADLEKRDNVGKTVLMQMATEDKSEVVRHLIARGANVNATNHAGFTALIGASLWGQTNNVRLLLAAGANPGVRAVGTGDPEFGGAGNTAEEWALNYGHADVARILRDHAARKPAP